MLAHSLNEKVPGGEDLNVFQRYIAISAYFSEALVELERPVKASCYENATLDHSY